MMRIATAAESFLAFVLIIQLPAFAPTVAAQDCSIFTEIFGPAQHTWSGVGASWAFSEGRLRATGFGTSLAYAYSAFSPSAPFVVDVEVELRDTTGEGMVGIYPLNTGSEGFDIGGGWTVEGLGAVLFPSGNAYLLGRDRTQGKYFQSSAHSAGSAVTSIGVRYSSSEIVLRVNRADTQLRVTGNFNAVPSRINTLRLLAQGAETTVAWFDNVCGRPAEAASPAAATGESLIFPYYQALNGSFTGFAISNFSTEPAQLQFRAYSNTGGLLPLPSNPRYLTLPAGGQLARVGHEIFEASPSAVQQGWVEVTSDNGRIGSFFQVGEADRLDGSVSLSGPERSLYFTRIYEGARTFRGQNAETFISLVNPGTSAVTIELALKETGSDRSVTKTLPAKACLYGTLSQIFSRAITVSGGYLSVKVTQGEGVAGFGLLRFSGTRTWVGLNAATPNLTSRLYSAQLASVPGLFTSVKLVNTSAQTRRATLYAVSQTGGSLGSPVNLELGAGKSFEGDAAALFGWGQGLSRVGSLRVEVNGPDVVGDVVFGDSAGLASAAALPLQTRLFTEGVFSQVANGLGLFTGLAFYNPGETAAQITLQVYEESGRLAGTRNLSLAAGRRDSQLLVEYLPQTEGQIRGYVKVTSTQPLVAQQLFGAGNLLSAVPPTMPRPAVQGPGGSYIQIADQSDVGGVRISLQPDDIAKVRETGETAVSSAIRVSVSTSGFVQGGDFHKISIPLSKTQPVTNRLTAKVLLTTGVILPVAGIYDGVNNAYVLELPALVNGWTFGVVESSSIARVPLEPAEGTAVSMQVGPAGWMTPVDWVTCEFHPIRHTNTVTDAQVRRDYLPSMWDACGALSWAGFRSPKLWIASRWNDTDLDPPGRVVHISETQRSMFQGSWDEEDENFATDDRTEEEMLALGQIYIKPSQLTQLNTDYGITLGNIFAHELFHAVQSGYDFRRGALQVGSGWQTSYKAYTEGTATPLGQTFQRRNGSVTGPAVDVRQLGDGESTPLDEPIDNHLANHYRKQDFWAWVARRYGNNSWAYTNQVFEQMGMATYRQFNRTNEQYLALYRKGTDDAFQLLFGKGFSEIYREFALDRAYEHSANALLRQSETSNWSANKLADTLFRAAGHKQIKPNSEVAAERQALFTQVKSLSTHVAWLEVTAADREEGEVILNFEVTGVPVQADGISIHVFREKQDRTMQTGGRMQVTEIKDPVKIPVNKDTRYLTILIINADLQVRTASVTVGSARKYELRFYQSWYDDSNPVYGTSFVATAQPCINAELTIRDAHREMPDGVYIMFFFPNGEIMFDFDREDMYLPEDGGFSENGQEWQIDYGICYGSAGSAYWGDQPRGTYRVDVEDNLRRPLISGTFVLQ